MSDSTLDGLARRLDRLERENRWWRRLGGGAAALVGLGLLLGATPAIVPDEIRARRFVVVDERGVERASVHASAIGLHDGRGKVRAQMVVKADGTAGLVLTDQSARERAALAVGTAGEPSLELYDDNRLTRAALGHTRLAGTQRGDIEVRPASSLVLFDRDHRVIWEAPRDDEATRGLKRRLNDRAFTGQDLLFR